MAARLQQRNPYLTLSQWGGANVEFVVPSGKVYEGIVIEATPENGAIWLDIEYPMYWNGERLVTNHAALTTDDVVYISAAPTQQNTPFGAFA